MIELWRRAQNPWGQDVLIGVSWNLMWAAVAAAAIFLVGHSIWYRTRARSEAQGEPEPTSAAAAAGVPERVPRHSLSARLFHWSMSAAMLTLLISAFVPVMGLEIPSWVTIHWIAGVVLILAIVYHIIHSIGWQDFWSMMSLGSESIQEGVAHIKHIISAENPEPPKAGKYPFDHRLYHHSVIVFSLTSVATGLIMMMRIDTPFWTRNPYVLSDQAVGWVFALHGLAGVIFIVMIAAHIYFAIRPEKRWITWSMIRGWVDRDHYLSHHDPTKWVVGDGSTGSGDPASGALADSAVSAPRDDG